MEGRFQVSHAHKDQRWLLQNGTYRCMSCSPIIEVKADGKDQPVKGQPYDTISVKVVDHQTVEEIEKKNGQTVSVEKLTVSDDGNTVTDEKKGGRGWRCAILNSSGRSWTTFES